MEFIGNPLLYSSSLLQTWVITEFKLITTAGAAMAIAVEEIWGEYVTVARQNSTLSSVKYKITTTEIITITLHAAKMLCLPLQVQ